MKKIILLVCIIAFATFKLIAQDFKKQSSLGISFGPSFPVGEFAHMDLYNEKSGLAAIGGFASISYDYQFSRFFGAVASITGRIHGVDKNALNSFILPSGSGSTLSLEAGTWKFVTAMAGISQNVPIISNDKLSLEIKEMAGIQFSHSPEVTTTGFIPGIGSLNNSEESQSVNSFAFGLGLGLKYKLANNLKLKLFGDYQGSNPKFTYQYDDVAQSYQVKQQTSAVNVGLGIAFGF